MEFRLCHYSQFKNRKYDSWQLGNDLALDGIYFGLCGKTVSITTPVTTFCEGTNTNIQANLETLNSNWSFYEWLKDGVVVASWYFCHFLSGNGRRNL